MIDFTKNTYILILQAMLRQGYSFFSVIDNLNHSDVDGLTVKIKSHGENGISLRINTIKDKIKSIILRHDVDANPFNSLKLARLEQEIGIKGTYYFRIIPGNYDEVVIREIASLGHEIGYHYETLAQISNRFSVNGNQKNKLNEEQMLDDAYMLFIENLARFREIVPVETICMHGSPLSCFDNREIWKKYDYRELGIIGEASMDIDFAEVAYYTDSGRRWDGARMSVRDKVDSRHKDGETKGLREEETEGPRDKGTKRQNIFPSYHSTFDMIKAVENGTFPEQAMITIHPQRWNDGVIAWTKELVWQNVKNVGKWFIIKMRENTEPPPPPTAGTLPY